MRKGSYFMDSEDCRRLVDERIIQADRQNISEILRDNVLEKWIRYEMLMISMGHFIQDEIVIEELH